MHHRVHPTASPPSVVMQTANLEGGSSAPGLGEVMRAMQDLMTRMDRLEQSRVHGQPPPPPPRVVADPQARNERHTEPRQIKNVVKFEVKPGDNLIIIEEVEQWQFAIESQFRLHKVFADRDRLDYMPEALLGVARGWLMTQTRIGAIHDGTTWEEFLSRLKEHFIPINPDEVNRAKYKVLTKEGVILERQIVEFSQKFLQAAVQVGDLSQKQMIFEYMQSLKKGKMKAHLHEHKSHYSTIQEVIKAACEFGNLKDTAYVLGGEGGSFSSASDPQPMDLNAMRNMQGQQAMGVRGQRQRRPRGDREPQSHRPRISPEEWQRRKDNHLCFVCGADDHISRECPGKQQQQERLANTILEEESDSSQSEDGDQ